MPCAAPSRNNLGVLGPCGYPNVQAVAGVDVSAQNLCYPHYALKWGHAGIPPGLMGGIDANTVFCFHADSMVDTQGHPLTPFGDAKISSAQSKFGGNSLLLDGSGDCVGSPASPDFAFGSGDFTIECWVNFNDVALPTQVLLALRDPTALMAWYLRYSAPNIVFYWSLDGTAVAGPTLAWAPVVGTWYHIAVARAGGTIRFFINGTQMDSRAISGAIFDPNMPLSIGGLTVPGPSQVLSGYMDEVRISKGVARWTSNFSVPTAPYT